MVANVNGSGLPQKVKSVVAKTPAKTPAKIPSTSGFAVAESLISDDDIDDVFEPFAVVSEADWRIERRYYTRQDGTRIMYWNYRSRKIKRTRDGRQLVKYKKGGKRLI